MADRAVHFVGSFPADSTDDAMHAMMRGAGSRLRTLPTGEIRRHETYLQPIIDGLVDQGALRVRRERPDRTVHRLRPGFDSGAMTLGYACEAREALPSYTGLRGASGPALQIGMPTDLTLGFVALGLPGVLAHRQVFTDATAAEMAAVHEVTGGDVVLQLEAPAELVLLAAAQPLHRVVDAALGLSRGICALAARAPEGARLGVHLCLGGRRNKARTTLRDTRPLVHLANAVARQWPSGRTLEYIHGPLAAGDLPPSSRPEFYAPLADLELGATAFVAGFVHEKPTEAELVHTLHLIEGALGRPVDAVASACGLGRHTREVAETLVARADALAAAD
ncbi:hypothetical protein [Nocardia stercoris]|uniref:Methionine synthase n=1 Tax=Nocardia stercoris TaxID=2483361 RepID=A0A3M2L5U3_9NOCA|nr:hypothetical protein [Nocardia stercoris]RMI32981.1 hypothetical protein EBN03_11740 [Nocardia stercoris]